MQPLVINVTPHPSKENVQIVSFEGDFDGYAKDNVDLLKDLAEKTVEGKALIFDMSKMNYLNSYAIGHLVNWYNKAKEQGGQILVVGINDQVKEIFGILGIDNLFQVYATLEEAALAIQ